jgi:2'-5' RNA ligase
MRLFIALKLPEDVRRRLTVLCNGLPGAKWVAPDNLHLTLRFLGELDRGQAADLDGALSALRVPGFHFELTGVGHYGSGRNVRVLWAGVAPNPAVLRLHHKIETAVMAIGLASDKHKFRPHVTLARFTSNPGAKLQDYLAHHALFRAGPIAAEHFTLYSSFLSASGAIHQVEAEYPLAPAEEPPASP